MTDINPMWRIKILTEQFGACGMGWYYEITKQEIIEGGNEEKVAFVNINLFVKYKEGWSKPIQGSGGSSFVAKESRGLYTSDECFKMALTDSIGSACKLLGIAADVYFEKDRSKYDSVYEYKPDKPDKPDKLDKPDGKKSNSDFITPEMLIELAEKKGVSQKSILSKYSASEIKFIKQESKKEAYGQLLQLANKE